MIALTNDPVDISMLAALWSRPHLREVALEIADRSREQFEQQNAAPAQPDTAA